MKQEYSTSVQYRVLTVRYEDQCQQQDRSNEGCDLASHGLGSIGLLLDSGVTRMVRMSVSTWGIWIGQQRLICKLREA